jgi:hypothetical protein
MAKDVQSVTRETRQQHKYALEKEVVEIECDDGSAYVFERPTEREGSAFRLARRVKPDGAISTSKAALPAAVKESVEATVSGWYK